jgi:glycosyltransferase involved in cell wall biosynthesis
MQISDLILFYAGVIHRSRGLIEILKALRDMDGVKLIVAGLGPDVKIFKNLPKILRNKAREYIGFISYKEVIRRSFEADVILALYDPKIPSNRYASPNKLFEAMMCAKPIIVNSETSAAKIVEKNYGLTVPYGDVNAIKNAIMHMRDDYNLRLMLGRNGRMAYKKRYGWKIMIKKLIRIYDKISARSTLFRKKANERINIMC